MLNYEKLSEEVSEKTIKNQSNSFAFEDVNVIGRDNSRDRANVIRIAFIRNIDKIMHCPYEKNKSNQIVVDYIASITDDYFVEFHQYLFPQNNKKIEYREYFYDLKI